MPTPRNPVSVVYPTLGGGSSAALPAPTRDAFAAHTNTPNNFQYGNDFQDLVQFFANVKARKQVIFGQDMGGSIGDALTARRVIDLAPTGTSSYTLVDEAINSSGVGNRIYTLNNGVSETKWVFTTNCYWDGSLWHKDVTPGGTNAASKVELTGRNIKFFIRYNNTAWNDSAWTYQPVDLGYDVFRTGLIPLLKTPFGTSTVYSILFESDSAANGSQRLYLHMNGGLVATTNAKWDGASLWTPDLAGSSYRFDFGPDGFIYNYANTGGVPFNDGVWNTPTTVVGDYILAKYMQFPTASVPAFPPSAGSANFFFKSNGLGSPNTRLQMCVEWSDGSMTVIAESPAS